MWSWFDEKIERAELKEVKGKLPTVAISEPKRGDYELVFESAPKLLFTENETNFEAVFGSENAGEFTKDGFNRYLIEDDKTAVNANRTGTRACAHYKFDIEAGGSKTVYMRLRRSVDAVKISADSFVEDCERVFEQRLAEADEFYADVVPPSLSTDSNNIMRQSFAGMLWSKQFYHYVVERMARRRLSVSETACSTRKRDETTNGDICITTTSFQCPINGNIRGTRHGISHFIVFRWHWSIPILQKSQLVLMLREWYMHPNGQIPAYEWAFGDVNPPVHAWAALRVYQIEQKTIRQRRHEIFSRRFFINCF